MKFLSIATAMLASSATALPGLGFLESRDVSPANKSLTSVIGGYKTLNTDVTNFQPNSLNTVKQFLIIRDDANSLTGFLNSTVSTVSTGGKFNFQDSLSLLIARLEFEPALIAYLILMIIEKPTFDSILGFISVRQEILAFLKIQRDLTYKMDLAFANQLAFPFGYAMQILAQAENILFNFTIAAYEIPAPAGHIEIPAGTIPDASQLPASAVPNLPAATVPAATVPAA